MNETDALELCPGAGKCHGCMSWCDACGNVGDVCDVRLFGERCDAHPRPPPSHELRASRRALEERIRDLVAALCDARSELADLAELERVSRVLLAQQAEDERRVMRAAIEGPV